MRGSRNLTEEEAVRLGIVEAPSVRLRANRPRRPPRRGHRLDLVEATGLGMPELAGCWLTPDGDVRLPDLEGPPGLAAVTERDLQRSVRREFLRSCLMPARMVGIINQRPLRHLSPAARRAALAALVADGLDQGACDGLFEWSATIGLGSAWIEIKRPVDPEPLKAKQVEFIAETRAMGRVAGVARSLEQAFGLLVQAGAPLRFLPPGVVPPPHKSGAPAGGAAGAQTEVPWRSKSQKGSKPHGKGA